MMKFFIAFGLILSAGFASAQVQKEDGTWWDNNLQFKVQKDLLKQFGELQICIYDSKRELCIENVVAAYEVRIYDATNKEIWNSLWTGKDMDMVFSKKFPTAHYVVIKATRPFVINVLSATRIYQDKPMELKYFVQ